MTKALSARGIDIRTNVRVQSIENKKLKILAKTMN
jgi:hypothetical protein